jgi:hypothetical protein
MQTEEKQEVRSAATTQRAEATVSDGPLKRAPRLSLPASCGSTADYFWYRNNLATRIRRGEQSQMGQSTKPEL